MKPYYEQSGITIYHGDCRDILPTLSCDVMLVDPPYDERTHAGARTAKSHSPKFGDIAKIDIDFAPLNVIATVPLLLSATRRWMVSRKTLAAPDPSKRPFSRPVDGSWPSKAHSKRPGG